MSIRQSDPTGRVYRIAVYFDTEEGGRHPLGVWSGTANSVVQARALALDALFDERLYAASCSPATKRLAADQ